jgi:predicted ATP-grasp superfamily ATP-dependent carboligase
VGVIAAVQEMLQKLTRAFGLRGVNGVDFVLSQGEAGCPVPYLVEVNPRYTASMELMEWAYGLNVFDLHVCSFAPLPPCSSAPLLLCSSATLFYGKAIVYARQDVVMPETVGWRAKGRKDIPFTGERITAGHPICTLLAKGKTRDECWHRLSAAAETVWREVERPVPNEGGDKNV